MMKMKRYGIVFAAAACLLFTACGTAAKDASGAQAAQSSTEETMENGLPASKQPDATAPDLDSVVIYVPDADGKLKGSMDAVDTLSEEALVEKLVDYGVLKNAEFVSFDITEADGSEEAGPGVSGGPGAAETEAAKTGVLTLKKVEAADGVSDALAEEAIVRTFAENYSLTDVRLVKE